MATGLRGKCFIITVDESVCVNGCGAVPYVIFFGIHMCGFGVPDNDRTWPSLFVRGPRLRPLSRDTSVLVVFLVACRSNDTK